MNGKSLRSARAAFNYLAPISRLTPPEPPFRYAYSPPPGRPLHNELLEPHEFEILNIRSHPEACGLDSSGFDTLHDVPTGFSNWGNDEDVTSKYYSETIQLLKEKLGATSVFIFDHTIRRRVPEHDAMEDRVGQRQPVYRVHVDQTPEAGQYRVLRHMGEKEGHRLLKMRAQIINVWRPLRGPVLDAPLGLLDIRSVDFNTDLVPGKLLYRDRTGFTYLGHHNPKHQWYYLSDMMPDEVILIKCYDNKRPRVIAPHSGFSFDTMDLVAYPRQSIEVRCLVFYEDEPVSQT